MTCPRCHAENREGRRFCAECGTSLALACPACGFSNEPGEKYCGGCGAPLRPSPTVAQPKFGAPESYTPKHLAEKILTSKSALEGERKQVTVLFADLKGSMELLADRDPEEARKLLDPVLERMMEAVHHYEGTVNQVMGDGIMALFGAPLAHEDHAVRACYAALRMQDSVRRYANEVRRREGVLPQIRVGLNSGEVVVRSIGSDLRMDYTAVGQTTHLAARMEQSAVPGTALITAETLNLAEGYVQVAPLGPIIVKGLAEAVQAYELRGAVSGRSRFQTQAARGLTQFVGRAPEIEQLSAALVQARAGHGQVVAVVGEAGVGKSRLFWEFRLPPRTDDCLTIEANSVSYGQATSYLPVIDLLRAYFQIESRDDQQKIREKVTGKLFSLDRGLEPSLPPLLGLLDVPVEDEGWTRLDPPQRRQRTLDGVKRLLLREAQIQPLVVVFEDLHWIDRETQAFLDGLVESLSTARILLLVSYRREHAHTWSAKTYSRLLRVDPLAGETVGELLEVVLGTSAELSALKRLLIDRTQGNPFFLEESVRALVETGALAGNRGSYRLAKPLQTFQVPATAQAILAARIDRLSPEDKRLLQTASVIGKDVPYALLQTLMDYQEDDALRLGLTRLQAAEFLYETRLFPDVEYTFKHALTHEVAYGGLLRERRRELHARVVAAIEALYGDRLDEHVERLAHHALRGELREKAVHYLRQAGLRAAARSALPDAATWLEQALAAITALPENQSTLELAFDIRLELRTVLHLFGQVGRALEHMREAESCAERLNDDRRRGRACAFMTAAYGQIGELDGALASGIRALTIAGAQGDLPLRVLSTSLLEQVHYFRGEYERVVELATDNLAGLPGDWSHEPLGSAVPTSVFDRIWLVHSLAELGRFAHAAENAAEIIQLAEATHHASSVGMAHLAAGVFRLCQGDWTKARSLLEHSIAAARAGNVKLVLPLSAAASAWVLAQLGEASEATSRVQESEELLDWFATAGHVSNLARCCYPLGRAYLLLGQLDEAQRLGERALASSPHHPGFAAHARHLLGDIATHSDRLDAELAETQYQQATALAAQLGMRPLAAHCHLGLGKLYHRTGDGAKAQEHLTTASAMYREMDMSFWLEQAQAELGGIER